MVSFPDVDKKYYCDFIDESCASGVSSTDLILPFFHTCNGEKFRSIIGGGNLLTSMCKEFSEELLYLFYGKPSYRLGDGGNTRDLGYFPASFVIKTGNIKNIKRIFPFDSGAFFCNILKDVCGYFETKPEARVGIQNYDLGIQLDRLAKFIKLFYGSDKAYFNVTPCLDTTGLKGMCFELNRLLELAQSSSTRAWDARATTAEIQIDQPINVGGSTIEAVIVATQLIANDADLQKFFYDEGIEVLTYNAARSKPNNVTELITGVAEKFLSDRALI